jgi:hypothetical protein
LKLRRDNLKEDQSVILKNLLGVSEDIQCANSLAQEFDGKIGEKKNGLGG